MVASLGRSVIRMFPLATAPATSPRRRCSRPKARSVARRAGDGALLCTLDRGTEGGGVRAGKVARPRTERQDVQSHDGDDTLQWEEKNSRRGREARGNRGPLHAR